MSGRIERRFAELEAAGRAGLITFLCAGDPDAATCAAILAGLPAAGADLIEIGMPFSDPMADGPAIQAGNLRALKAGMTLAGTLELVRDFRAGDDRDPGHPDGLLQPDLQLRRRALPRRRQGGRRRRPDHRRSAARGGRRALPAGARARLVLHPPGDADHRRPAAAQGAREHQGLHLLRLDHRHHRRRRAGRRAGPGARSRACGATPSCRSRSASASARPSRRARSPRVADAAVVGSALVDRIARSLDGEGRARPGLVEAVLDQVRALAAGVRSAKKAAA